jgi:hypothetical protein
MDIQTYNSYEKNIFINIKNITPSVSVLYFTDENKNTINIPNNTEMYIYYEEKPTLLDSYMDRYFISFTDNYELIINGNVMRLINKRIWDFI